MIPGSTAALLEQTGWCRFDADDSSRAWALAAAQAGRAMLGDPALCARHMACGGTWFVGVDALPTEPDGSLNGVPLGGPAIQALAPLPPLHRAQLSVVFPGYPRPREGESEAAFRYRQRRDAAHVDGIRAEGPGRRRHVREPHGYILGVPLTEAGPDAAPLVVWEGSHHILRAALRARLGPGPEAGRADADVTEAYTAARAQVFQTCRRVALTGPVGSAVLLHSLLLHGVAPWQPGAAFESPGRMMAYFRPLHAGGHTGWLAA